MNLTTALKQFSDYKTTWTICWFRHRGVENSKWSAFKKKYENRFVEKIFDNSISYFHGSKKDRIEWICNNIPKNCSVQFWNITDKQFGDSIIYYK